MLTGVSIVASEMANYSKNEFPYARPLADALLGDGTFRRWLLADTRFAAIATEARPLPEDQSKLRTTPNARKWWWFNHYCSKDGRCSCKVGTGLETDILLIFDTLNDYRFALHVEVKPPGESSKRDKPRLIRVAQNAGLTRSRDQEQYWLIRTSSRSWSAAKTSNRIRGARSATRLVSIETSKSCYRPIPIR
jgi:hypothetical protein